MVVNPHLMQYIYSIDYGVRDAVRVDHIAVETKNVVDFLF
jgi:hypothetical protein